MLSGKLTFKDPLLENPLIQLRKMKGSRDLKLNFNNVTMQHMQKIRKHKRETWWEKPNLENLNLELKTLQSFHGLGSNSVLYNQYHPRQSVRVQKLTSKAPYHSNFDKPRPAITDHNLQSKTWQQQTSHKYHRKFQNHEIIGSFA